MFFWMKQNMQAEYYLAYFKSYFHMMGEISWTLKSFRIGYIYVFTVQVEDYWKRK